MPNYILLISKKSKMSNKLLHAILHILIFQLMPPASLVLLLIWQTGATFSCDPFPFPFFTPSITGSDAAKLHDKKNGKINGTSQNAGAVSYYTTLQKIFWDSLQMYVSMYVHMGGIQN